MHVSKKFSLDNLKKFGLYVYFYDFSIDYDNSGVDNMLYINKYLMVKNLKQYFD